MNMQKRMNKTGRAFILSIITIAQITVQTSCTKDDNQLAGNTPLTLFAQTDAPQTRTTVNNTWNPGDVVQVVVNDGPAEVFTVQADGVTLKNSTSYWQSASQTIKARAWYPTVWKMQANQSSNENFQKADFLFAPEVSGITLANYTTNPLTFYHKTAKVTANLLPDPAGTVTAADIAGATTTVRFFGYTTENANQGNGTLSGSNNDWITPNKKSSNEYTALLIPQNMAGKQFMEITIDGLKYYYTPTGTDADLKEGHSYTYNITVKNTGLEVTGASSSTWTISGDYDVTATEAASIP